MKKYCSNKKENSFTRKKKSVLILTYSQKINLLKLNKKKKLKEQKMKLNNYS